MKPTYTSTILRILSKAHKGLTAWQLMLEMPSYENDFRTFHVNVSSIVRRGMIKSTDTTECDKCGSNHTLYRITEKGRLHLESGLYRREK